MTRYTVHFQTSAHTYLTVDAESPEEAREVADDEFEASFLCAQCSGWGSGPSTELGEVWEQDDSATGVWLA